MTSIVEKIALFALMSILLLPSCEKSKRISCNPELEDWTENNRLRFKSASPEEFLTLPLDKQRAMFSLLPAETQCEIWHIRQKKEQESSELSGSELQEYLSFLKSLTPFDFSKVGEKECLKKSEAFIKHMKTKYLWDERKEFFYLHTWLTEEEYSEALMLQILSSSRSFSRLRGNRDTTEHDSLSVVDTSEVAVIDSLSEKPINIPDCDCIYNIGCGIGTMRLCEKGVSCMPVQHCGFIPNHSDCTGRCM